MRLLLVLLVSVLLSVPSLADPATPQQQLSLAMAQKKVDRVQAILAQNPGLVNVPFEAGGSTPLLSALGMQAEPPLLNALLDAGANPNLPGRGGMTPLSTAVSTGQAAATTLLLSRGANPNIQDAKGKTALHLAVSLAMLKDVSVAVAVTQALLNGRANPNVADSDGRMPLHLAIFMASTKGDPVAASLVTVLCAGGADPKAPITFGSGGGSQTLKLTPVQLAQRLNATKTMEALARAGG